MSLLTALDFPRWTRFRLGLAPTADLAEEIERHITTAEDHLRYVVGDDAFDELADEGAGNADRRRRFVNALPPLVESRLYGVHAETLGAQAGSSTQGGRSRTVTAEASRGARSAAERAYTDFVQAMFQLGVAARATALNDFYTPVSR